jgi:hypothetical protein
MLMMENFRINEYYLLSKTIKICLREIFKKELRKMKLSIKILVLSLLLFVGCQNNESKSEAKSVKEDSLDKKAIAKLYEVVREAKSGKDVELNENQIRVDKIKIRVTTNVEFDNSREDKWIFAARFDTQIVDVQETKITIGSIGIGKDREDAVNTSIDEWLALFGTSLSQLFSKSEMTITMDNFEIYPGLAGIRGEAPSEVSGSSKEGQKRIIEKLLPILKKSSKELSSINLMLNVSKTGIVDGECRINNQISQEALNEIKKLEWKVSETGYIYKQFYLVKAK